MTITVGFVKERKSGESRVAMVPETAEKILKLGWQVLFEPDAGESAGFLNAAYPQMCQMAKRRNDVLNAADVLVGVDVLSEEDLGEIKNDSIVIGMVAPYQNQQRFDQASAKNITVFSNSTGIGFGHWRGCGRFTSDGHCQKTWRQCNWL